MAFHRYVRALSRLCYHPQRDHHQDRLAPVPLPGEVAVDGSVPDALGVAWLPRTAVGAGDEPGDDGDAETRGLPVEGAGGPDRAADVEGLVVVMDDGDGVVADVDGLAATVGGALGATVGDELAATREAPGLV